MVVRLEQSSASGLSDAIVMPVLELVYQPVEATRAGAHSKKCS